MDGVEPTTPEIPGTAGQCIAPQTSVPSSEIPAQVTPRWFTIATQSKEQFDKSGHPKKRLAIVGFAPTKDLAPYGDPSWEIWGLNDLHRAIPRWSRWFDIHSFDNIETDVVAGRTSNAARKTNIPDSALEHMGISGLSKLTCPIYMQEEFKEVTWAVKFPLEEMLKFWKLRGLCGARYLTNSISYMIAYALFEGVITGRQWDEISIFGVDMAVGVEYIAQRPSCEYWIGIAEGMGVHVYIPDASDLCKTTFLYAWEEGAQKAYEGKLDKITQDAQARMNMYLQQKAEIDRLLHHCEAQIGVVSDMKRVWSNLDTRFKI